MSETTQTETLESRTAENALIRQEPPSVTKTTEKPKVVYDAEAKNRFAFTAREGVKQYETAHIFDPLSDARFMQFLRSWHIKGNDDDVSEESREASCQLWNDQISVVEKIKYPEGEDFRDLIGSNEKIEGIKALLAVAIAEDLELVEGDRDFSVPNKTQTVLTEAFFNNEISVQTHELKLSNFEWEKKYSRIQQKRFKQEATRGLRRQPKIEYIPQDEKLGELYDEMFVSQEGFANGKIPLRFKTTVVHHLFEEKLDQKKSER